MACWSRTDVPRHPAAYSFALAREIHHARGRLEVCEVGGDSSMLTDAQADEIKRGLASGIPRPSESHSDPKQPHAAVAEGGHYLELAAQGLDVAP